MRSRGRVFGLSVSLSTCLLVCLSVCPPLFGLFASSRHSQEPIIHSTGIDKVEKVACRWSAIEKTGF